jgi:SAM-dependent methyltransferase
MTSALTLPLPPQEMRELIGTTDPADFDNPTGELVLPDLDPRAYEAVLDFGCGCGRLARQLLQQRPRPGRYLGIDLHPGMVAWCERNLAPADPDFEFRHHDVFNPGLNPGEGKPRTAPLPAADDSMSLVIAHSVFTHLLQDDVEHYLDECARVLRPDGILHATFFVFDKAPFPMMQDFQNALYINAEDPTNAVILDRDWLRQAATRAGLTVVRAQAPGIRGYQTTLQLTPARAGVRAVEFPTDRAPLGVKPPPVPEAEPTTIGADGARDGDPAGGRDEPARFERAPTGADDDADAHAREAARQRRLADQWERHAGAQQTRAEQAERRVRRLERLAAVRALRALRRRVARLRRG